MDKIIVSLPALLLAVLLFTACSASRVATQADVDRVSGTFPGYTLAALEEGKTHYQTSCGVCHGLKKPSSLAADQWKNIVPKMAKMANKQSEKINAKTQESILRYLITMSKK